MAAKTQATGKATDSGSVSEGTGEGGISPARSALTASSAVNKKKALMDLKELLDADILTQEEFDAEKTKVLRGS